MLFPSISTPGQPALNNAYQSYAFSFSLRVDVDNEPAVPSQFTFVIDANPMQPMTRAAAEAVLVKNFGAALAALTYSGAWFFLRSPAGYCLPTAKFNDHARSEQPVEEAK